MNTLAILSAISFSARPSVVQTVVYLSVLGIIWWLVGYLKVPEPILTIIRAVLIIAAVVVLIAFLLGITGTSM